VKAQAARMVRAVRALRSRRRWLPGHKVRLLENGEEFFPAVFDAIRNSGSEVLLETFILFEDKVGMELHAALLQAAQRGVEVDVLVDGFGSADLSAQFLGPLLAAGVRVRSFDPSLRVLGQRLNVLRRMHRKLVVVDGRRAFVGGINYSADHLADFGPQAKQDYAVELEGPIVDEIRRFALGAIGGAGQGREPSPVVGNAQDERAGVAGDAEALFVRRDNHEHRNDIERHYRAAIRSARKRVLIANAYFFPGYRLLHELCRAARRGVDVQLILQGEPDMAIARTAASLLYEHLHREGVKIFEYCERPLHGKVAQVDDDWATVGSSNLDPLSLSLNLEANVIVRDREFAAKLRSRLEHLIARACKQVTPAPARGWRWWAELRAFVVFHFMRHFPRLAEWLPRHAPRLEVPPAASAPVGEGLALEPASSAAAVPALDDAVQGVVRAR
jgi:cardiolipin synthase